MLKYVFNFYLDEEDYENCVVKPIKDELINYLYNIYILSNFIYEMAEDDVKEDIKNIIDEVNNTKYTENDVLKIVKQKEEIMKKYSRIYLESQYKKALYNHIIIAMSLLINITLQIVNIKEN